MENASKALIMAGSVLLSLLIIGVLVLSFNSLSNLKQTEASSEDVEKLAEYNKQIEKFNRAGLYGSELISLANLIDDYNKRQSDLKGYQSITLEVHLKRPIGNIKKDYNNYTELIADFKELEDNLNKAKNKRFPRENGITVERLAGMRSEELEKYLEDREESSQKDYCNELINEYEIYKTDLTAFKRIKFQQPSVNYDENTVIYQQI